MNFKFISTAFFALMFASNVAAESLHSKLAGKTFTNDDFVVTLKQNGILRGKVKEFNAHNVLRGGWLVRDGKFCRTIGAPARLVGSECMTVTFEGDMVTFVAENGRTAVYTMN